MRRTELANPIHELLNRIRRDAVPHERGELRDADLLERFARRRDEAAFEVLVWRHGGLILSLARRWLGDTDEAEDAFQATFLTLARKAGSIHAGGSLSSWLYRVACRISWRVSQRRSRLRTRERPLDGSEIANSAAYLDGDLTRILDQEIDLLPAGQRSAVILCYLEGRSAADAAVELGCPRGTVLSRLDAARRTLRRRLLQRGIAPAVIAGLTLESVNHAPAASIVLETVRVSCGYNVISSEVLLMSTEVIQAMFWKKCRVVLAFALFAGVCGIGSGIGRAELPAPEDDAKQVPQKRLDEQPPSGDRGQPGARRPDDPKARVEKLRSDAEAALNKVDELDRKFSDERGQAQIHEMVVEEKYRALQEKNQIRIQMQQRELRDLQTELHNDVARVKDVEHQLMSIGNELRQLEQSAKSSTNEAEKKKLLDALQRTTGLRSEREVQLDRLKEEIQKLQHDLEKKTANVAQDDEAKLGELIEMRKEMLLARQHLDLMQRSQERRMAFANADLDQATIHLRLAGQPETPAQRTRPDSANESAQKIERLQRELADLRREVQALKSKKE
jgi:RNA polymerase sigma factor (sigma-70 family)